MSRTVSKEKVFDTVAAPFWKRLLAWLADQAILGVLIFLVLSLLGGMGYDYMEIFQITLLANMLYFTAIEGYTGQTLGKHLLGIIVFEEDGERLTFTSALFRRIGTVIPVFSFIDAGAILLTSKSQRIFDIIASTVVVKKENQEHAVRLLRGEDITEDLLKESELEGVSDSEKSKDRKTLEGLRKMRKKLDERYESGVIEEDEYTRLKSKYESRIGEMKEKLEED